jgi:hypothetical protein
MERVVKKLPLYLLLAVPAGFGCVYVLGPEWGLLAGVVANLALWHILLRPRTEADEEA